MSEPAVLGGPPAFPEGLRFVRPDLPPLDDVVARLAPGWVDGLLTNGPLVRELEARAAERLGVRHVVAVSSCTSGLMLALHAAAPDGPVALPSFTFSASGHAVRWVGSQPAFVECDPWSFQVDLVDLERVAAGSAALLGVHVFGAPCGAETIEALAERSGIPVVFDAAHAFGAVRGGRPVGGFGTAEVFSLSPTKVVVGGEGGLVATDDDGVAEHVRLGRDYGNPGDYDTRFCGLNARMSELHAAVALESLGRLDRTLARRRALAGTYRAALADIPGVTPQVVDGGDESTHKDLTVRIDPARFGLDAATTAEALRAEGVDTRRYFWPPLHRQRAYRDVAGRSLPVTDDVATSVLSLPVYPGLTEAEVGAVAGALVRLHRHAARARAVLAEPRATSG